jgi:hypothetical protein
MHPIGRPASAGERFRIAADVLLQHRRTSTRVPNRNRDPAVSGAPAERSWSSAVARSGNDVLAHTLVDEVHLVGVGMPIFDGKPPVALSLGRTRTSDVSGKVLVRYQDLARTEGMKGVSLLSRCHSQRRWAGAHHGGARAGGPASRTLRHL